MKGLGCIVLGVIGIAAIAILLVSFFFSGWLTLSILLGIFGYLAFGFTIVQQQQRKLVELFGEYHKTLKPGLRWILPGAMKVRATISVWEQKIALFEVPIKIDFKDGSAIPKGAEAFVKVKKPDHSYSAFNGEPENEQKPGVFRAIYHIANWRVAAKDLLENAIRSYLNGLSIDQGITEARAGFDLVNRLPKEQQGRLQEAMARWGFELMQVTIMDFDLEPELVKARGEVQIRKKAAEAAEYVRVQSAQETVGFLIQTLAMSTGKTFEEIQRRVDTNPELKTRVLEFIKELVTRRMSLDRGALEDIRVSGAGDLGGILMAIIAAIRGRTGTQTPSTPPSS